MVDDAMEVGLRTIFASYGWSEVLRLQIERTVPLPDALRSKAAAMLAPTATCRRYTTIGARAGLPREARYSCTVSPWSKARVCKGGSLSIGTHSTAEDSLSGSLSFSRGVITKSNATF